MLPYNSVVNMCGVLRFVTSQTKKSLLIHTGFLHAVRLKSTSTMYQRCVEYFSGRGCSARIKTFSMRQTGNKFTDPNIINIYQ